VQPRTGAEEQPAPDNVADGDHLDLAVTARFLVAVVLKYRDIGARFVMCRIFSLDTARHSGQPCSTHAAQWLRNLAGAG
jgi:hypothetical protein